MASEVKVDKLSQQGSSGIVLTDAIKLSSGKAIKNAAGTALLGEDGALGGVTFPAGHITDTAIFLIENETIATTSASTPDYFVVAPANAMTISMGSAEKLIVQYAGGRTGTAVNNRNCIIVRITDGSKTETIKAPCYGYGDSTRDASDGGFIVSGIGYSGTTTVSLGVQSLDNSNTSQWIADDGSLDADPVGVYVLLQIYTPS